MNNNYCPKCGNSLNKDFEFCPKCGNQINSNVIQPKNTDHIDKGLNSLAFLFPVVGFILYLVKLGDYPIKARCIGKYTLLGFLFWFLFYLIFGFRIRIIGF